MKKEPIKYTIPSLRIFITENPIFLNKHIPSMHYHRAIELLRVNEGEVVFHLKNNKIPVKKNEFLLINQNELHWLEPKETSYVEYIQIDITNYISTKTNEDDLLIEKFLRSLNQKSYALFENNKELTTIYDNILFEHKKQQIGYERYIEAAIYHLIAFMFRNQVLTNHLHHNGKLLQIAQVVNYINNNYTNKLRLEDLAKLIHGDKYRLCKLFKNATGGTVVDYINFVRLHRAEQLIFESELNTSEIALECGYASIQYFNKVFKNSVGCSPGQFKRLQTNYTF